MLKVFNYPKQIFRHKLMLILVFVIVGVVLVGLLVSLPVGRSGKISKDTLSDRAQEFIQSEQQNSNSIWKNKTVTTSETPPASKITTVETACFSITLPVPIRSVEKNNVEDCLVTLRIISPPSRLTISLTPLSVPLKEHSAIVMRDANHETYTPIEFTSDLYAQSKVYSDPQGLGFFAEINHQLLSVVFSETADQEKIIRQTLLEVLTAIQIEKQES